MQLWAKQTREAKKYWNLSSKSKKQECSPKTIQLRKIAKSQLKSDTPMKAIIWQTPTGNENIFRSGLFHVAIKKQIIHT
jgi:hypothetical protein